MHQAQALLGVLRQQQVEHCTWRVGHMASRAARSGRAPLSPKSAQLNVTPGWDGLGKRGRTLIDRTPACCANEKAPRTRGFPLARQSRGYAGSAIGFTTVSALRSTWPRVRSHAMTSRALKILSTHRRAAVAPLA